MVRSIDLRGHLNVSNTNNLVKNLLAWSKEVAEEPRCLSNKGYYTLFKYKAVPVGIKPEYVETYEGSYHYTRKVSLTPIIAKLKRTWGDKYVITDVVITGGFPSNYRVFEGDNN